MLLIIEVQEHLLHLDPIDMQRRQPCGKVDPYDDAPRLYLVPGDDQDLLDDPSPEVPFFPWASSSKELESER